MITYKYLLATFLLLITAFVNAYATWSIIVADPVTKQIGIAGASCTYSVYGIGGIIPGQGAIIVQAMSNKAAKAEGLQMIVANAHPQQILDAIKDPGFAPEEQQYGIVCINNIDEPATYTGKLTHPSKGALTARGISVQGNLLSDEAELQAILDAAIQAQKDKLGLEEVLMKALEAGARLGGDKRCGARKASSAFLTVAKPGDQVNKPFLNLVVTGTDDRVNAVEVLRKQFNYWKHKQNE